MSAAQELLGIASALREAALGGRSAALATITATHGTTFRRTGARMLVWDDGRVVSELSGGCPQRDLVLRAQRAIANGRPEVIHYDANSVFDALAEMGCGGELDVLIEPIAMPGALTFFDALANALDARHKVSMATLFALNGEVVPPRRLLWSEKGKHFDELGAATLPHTLMHTGALQSDAAATVQLSTEQGMADVLIESIEPLHTLFAIGDSATARALLAAGAAIGWQTILVDSAPERLGEGGLPAPTRLLHTTPEALHAACTFDEYSSVVVMTHNLKQDLAWLGALRAAPLAYLGAIGSRERALRMQQAVPERRLYAPAGLDIGAETPSEIACAIVAEINAVRCARRGGMLCEGAGTLHP